MSNVIEQLMRSALKRAIKIGGGPAKVSDRLGVSRTSPYSWKKCPVHHVLQLEALTGISRHRLRPDIFGPVVPESVEDTA